MITLSSFTKDIVELIKPLMPEEWTISSDLGDLTENKDKIAYFAVTNQNSVIYNNATLHLDCEFVGTLLFEQRTKDEIINEIQKIADAALSALKSIKRYAELDCGAIFLECNPSMLITEVDDLYYSFKLPVVIYAQF